MKNGAITKHQHGFMRKLSTETNLLASLNDWTLSIEDRVGVSVVYIDFTRAFDSVSRQKLIHKLKYYNITEPLLSYISDFLSNRTHCTRVGNSLSPSLDISSGVVQGSCLGPVLFLLYINDLLDVFDDSVITKLFADDAKLYTSIRTNLDIENLQLSLNKLVSWSVMCQLMLAIKKCCTLNICLDENLVQNEINLKLDETILVNETFVSDLGVTIDESLSFNVHIDNIVKKASVRSNLILRCFVSRNRTVLLNCFKVYVRPLLEYCSSVWSPVFIKDIAAIEGLQKTFTKRLPGCKNLTYFQRLNHLKIDSLEIRRLRHDLIFMYKVIFGYTGLCRDDFITINTNHQNINLRSHPHQINRPNSGTRQIQNFLFYRCSEIWNSLPPTVSFISLQSFKNSIPDSFLVQHCRYNFN